MEESAFVSRRASSRVPTFQDIVGLTFRGQSLQISASADFSLANAIAPRSGLKQRYNSHSLFWDGLSLVSYTLSCLFKPNYKLDVCFDPLFICSSIPKKFTSIDGSDSIISLSSESVKAFAAQQVLQLVLLFNFQSVYLFSYTLHNIYRALTTQKMVSLRLLPTAKPPILISPLR